MKTMMKLATVFMVVFLLTLPSFAQQGQGKNDGNRKGWDLQERLNLTDAQMETIDGLRLEHEKEMIDLKSDLEKTRLKMKELINKGDVDRASFIAVQTEIMEKENALKLAKANHMMDVYEQLNDEQKDEWLEMAERLGKHREMREHFGKRKFPGGEHRHRPDRF